MKKTVLVQGLVAAAAAALLISCGGGGGAPFPGGGSGGTGGGGSGGGGSGTATSTPSPAPLPPTLNLSVLNAQGTPTLRLSAAETAKARVQLLKGDGSPVADAAVTFSSDDKIQLPVTGGLTDSSGFVTLDFSAAANGYAGLATISANATIGSEVLSTSRTIVFSSQPATTVDPVTLANSILLSSVTPADKSIVIKGAGATGRSETATITFRVLDPQGNPVKDVPVNFSANPSTVVDVTIPTANTDSNGYVKTTVSSKSVADTVIVKAVVPGTALQSQSDQLIVSTGQAVAAAMDLSVAKFNLDGTLSGDTTDVTVRLSDANGNPVAGGVAVAFTTDAGAVGTSGMGGCTTDAISGVCKVPFSVQNPRGTGLATVKASVNTGNTSFAQTIMLNMAAAVTAPVLSPSVVTVSNTCEALATITLGDGSGRALAAGSTITAEPTINSKFDVSVVNGSPVLDSRNLQPTTTRLKFITGKPGNAVGVPAIDAGCDVSNAANNTYNDLETVEVTIKTPGGSVFKRNITVNYLRKP